MLALPAQFATGNQTLGAFRELVYFGLAMNYFDTYVPNVQKVDGAAAEEGGRQVPQAGDPAILVVGDGKTVLPKLKELAASKDVGGGGKDVDVVILDSDGKPITGG